MLIDSITISNFKGYAKQEFTFSDNFTVIIGDNGAGKTSALDAIAIAAGCFLIPLGGGQKYQRTIKKWEVRRIEIKKSVFEYVLPCVVEASGDWGKWRRTIETYSFSNTTKETKDVVKIAKRLFDTVGDNGNMSTLPVFAYHGTGRLWAELTDHVAYAAQGSRIDGYDNCFSIKSSSTFFRNWYKTLEKNIDKKDSEELKYRLDIFKRAIISCLDDYDDLYYDFGEDDIICVREDAPGHFISIPYRMMSDGYRNMIGMIADIAYRCIKLNPHLGVDALKESEGIVLIDELDLHLHPVWQKKIVSELTRCFPKIQFIATTHSPFIVQSLKKAQVINLEKIPLARDPYSASLEENACYMGVVSPRSEFFNIKEKAALDFFNELEHFNGSEAMQQQMQSKIDEYLKYYSDDAAFIAQLKLGLFTKVNTKY